jgi:hypothetical protein
MLLLEQRKSEEIYRFMFNIEVHLRRYYVNWSLIELREQVVQISSEGYSRQSNPHMQRKVSGMARNLMWLNNGTEQVVEDKVNNSASSRLHRTS